MINVCVSAQAFWIDVLSFASGCTDVKLIFFLHSKKNKQAGDPCKVLSKQGDTTHPWCFKLARILVQLLFVGQQIRDLCVRKHLLHGRGVKDRETFPQRERQAGTQNEQ